MKNTIKNILFFCILCYMYVLNTQITYGCDPLGCLFGGHKQDILILGEVTNNTQDGNKVKIIFVFPQSRLKSIKKGDEIKVTNPVTIRGKYLFSLNKNGNIYKNARGTYEITGNNYFDAKLIENNSIDDEALQIFINTSGTESNFGFDYSNPLKPVLIRNKQHEQNSIDNNIGYKIIIGVMILLVGLVTTVLYYKKIKNNNKAPII